MMPIAKSGSAEVSSASWTCLWQCSDPAGRRRSQDMRLSRTESQKVERWN